MRVVGVYSFNNGREVVEQKYPRLLEEIYTAVETVDASRHITKKSKEKTKTGRMLYSPSSLNKAFKKAFYGQGWQSHREKCAYSTEFYVDEYVGAKLRRGAYREMDFIKEKLGIEIQFDKHSPMVCNVCAKMTIFSNLGCIDTGVEIVPVKEFALEMSSGVSYFEQFVWDLEQRGVSNIDVPVLILGIADGTLAPPP